MSEIKLTDEQRAKLKPWADRWSAHSHRTGQLSSEEKESIRAAIFGLYERANLERPRVVTFAPSPYTAAIAYGICEGILDSEQGAPVKYATALRVAKARVELALARLEKADVDAKPRTTETSRAIVEEVMRLVREICFENTVPSNWKKTTKFNSELEAAMIDGVRSSHEAANAGNQASAWVAHVTFFRYELGYDADYSRWDNYEKAAYGGPRYMHEQFTIVSDLPTRVCIDDRRRAHSPDGPSHAWRDGWKVYSWRNVRIPAAWIEEKEKMDPIVAINHRNIEQRRCAAEIIGWNKIVEKLKPKVIDKHDNAQIGTLLEVNIPDSGPTRFLQVLCGTGRTFCIPVPNRYNTAIEANAGTFNLRPEDLVQLEFRT